MKQKNPQNAINNLSVQQNQQLILTSFGTCVRQPFCALAHHQNYILLCLFFKCIEM